jgi:hypothetical protein
LVNTFATMSTALDASLPPATVFARLEAAVQHLVVTAHTLYGGNWDDCAEDLRRRSEGKPYLYRVKVEVDDAPGWLARLKAYEQARGERFAVDAPDAKDHH